MTDKSQHANRQWTRKQAAILSFVCLSAGILGGWLIPRGQSGSQIGLRTPVVIASTTAARVPMPEINSASPGRATPDSIRLKQMADAQAAPLLDKLKLDSANPDLLSSIGNLYYDAQQYSTAVDYYARSLKSRPSAADVRTDMGTAYWYMGNTDLAIKEFNKALTYAPNNPNTLFNLGIVKWKSRTDIPGAVAAWSKLLAANPTYQAKDEVKQMLAQAEMEASSGPTVK